MASGFFTDTVEEHVSLAKPLEHNSDVWAKLIHNREDVDGLGIGGLMKANYTSQVNGIVAGKDIYHKGDATLSAAFTYLEGTVNGSTLATSLKNENKHYGVSLYGSIKDAKNGTNLIGDISYMHGTNDIKQQNSGYEITGSPSTDSFSLGLKGEKEFKVGFGRLVPYAGFRFLHLGAFDYSNNLGMNYSTGEKDMAIIPIGLKYSVDTAYKDWQIRTLAEAGYIWNLGSSDVSQNISWNGAQDSYYFNLADRNTFVGRLGLEFAHGNMAYGLGFEFLSGSSSQSNRLTFNLNWSF